MAGTGHKRHRALETIGNRHLETTRRAQIRSNRVAHENMIVRENESVHFSFHRPALSLSGPARNHTSARAH